MRELLPTLALSLKKPSGQQLNFKNSHIPPRALFDHAPQRVARMLLGMILFRRLDNGERVGGKIVETEAYLDQGDPAAHHVTRGSNKTTSAKFMTGGAIYIHRIHRHFCMDIVTQEKGIPSSVLIRALEPLLGLDEMKRARGTSDGRILTNGPGKLCQALCIDARYNCCDILDPACGLHLRLPHAPVSNHEIAVTRRIGISNGADLQLRYFIKNNQYASGTRAQNAT